MFITILAVENSHRFALVVDMKTQEVDQRPIPEKTEVKPVNTVSEEEVDDQTVAMFVAREYCAGTKMQVKEPILFH